MKPMHKLRAQSITKAVGGWSWICYLAVKSGVYPGDNTRLNDDMLIPVPMTQATIEKTVTSTVSVTFKNRLTLYSGILP